MALTKKRKQHKTLKVGNFENTGNKLAPMVTQFKPEKPVPLPIFVEAPLRGNTYSAFLHTSIASLIMDAQGVLDLLR